MCERFSRPPALDQHAQAVGGRHDLCLRFAQPSLQPMWALDAVQLLDREN